MFCRIWSERGLATQRFVVILPRCFWPFGGRVHCRIAAGVLGAFVRSYPSQQHHHHHLIIILILLFIVLKWYLLLMCVGLYRAAMSAHMYCNKYITNNISLSSSSLSYQCCTTIKSLFYSEWKWFKYMFMCILYDKINKKKIKK